MITLFAAAAVAAAQPATTAGPDQHAQHASMAQRGDMPAGEHAKKEKCCCDDMAKEHEGHSEHGTHSGE